MSQFLIAASTWLHSLSTVIFIGYYVLLAVLYLPALQANSAGASGAILSEISKRSRAWLYGSLIVLAVTGAYLTLVDPKYLGLANFNNAWTILMLVKHTVVFVMVVIGFWFNAILRAGPMAGSTTGAPQAFRLFRSHANMMAAAGIVVLLLTAISVVQ